MQKECHHTRESLAEEVLYAHRLLLDGDGELAGERLLSTIRHMCERVERHEDGWLTRLRAVRVGGERGAARGGATGRPGGHRAGHRGLHDRGDS
jgi:hypothetical protein